MKRLASTATWWQCSTPQEFSRGQDYNPPHTGRPVAMHTIGIDLHKRESQLCILAETGEITERRIALVVLSTTSWPRIRVATDAVASAVARCATGRLIEVVIP